ncbi:helix-turn-helix domain-containing protein [Microbacterium sp.]|uniref:helix-turn-helix domain-containing protein n=1 Tax=Microbacterium sp. TaxID=51671 RepID=UPI0039E2FDF1
MQIPTVIAPMVVGPRIEEHEPVLLWVHTGAAAIDAGGARYRLTAGTAIWVPPGIAHCIRTEEGAVVLPFFLRPTELHGALAEVHTVEIPSGWTEWMIHRWDDNSYTRETLRGAELLLQLVAAERSRERQGAPRSALPLPRSDEALRVARTLLRRPGSPWDIESLAQRERVSAKTLQRQFRNETGLTFTAWRTRARIASATGRLADGGRITQVGRDVGYATPAGFTKAFQQHTGLTPRDYVRGHRSATREFDESVDGIEHALILGHDLPEASPGIPARSFWQRINDHHELMWVYRGTATLRIGARAWQLRQGQAIWVPTGLTHAVEFAAESLMLTIGTAHGRVEVDLDELIVFDIPHEWEPFLLHTMAAEFTLLRPESGHGAFTRMLFAEQFIPTDADSGSLTGILGEIARSLRRNPADARCLADWAAHFRIAPRELGRAVLAQTGDTFPQWRSRLRMDIARELLRWGETPSQLSRRLGYAHPAAFTRAFTTVYGMSPRDYRRRERARLPPPTSRAEAS